jgi:hypothetical protein
MDTGTRISKLCNRDAQPFRDQFISPTVDNDIIPANLRYHFIIDCTIDGDNTIDNDDNLFQAS